MPPSLDTALQELRPLTTVLYEHFPEVATRVVIPYFYGRGHLVNHRLATDMLRYEICKCLREADIDAHPYDEPESTHTMRMSDLANNGIEGVFSGWPFKVLRSRDGDVPPPGRSTRKKAYFQQLPLFSLPNEPDSLHRPNVVVLWDCDQAYTRFTLRLAQPFETRGSYGHVRCRYNEVIPHPATEVQTPLGNGHTTGSKTELDLMWKKSEETDCEQYGGQQDDIWREDQAI